jgi:hypothetical protein
MVQRLVYLLLAQWLTGRVFGLALAYHTLSLAIEQLSIKIIALQWIFGKLNQYCSLLF